MHIIYQSLIFFQLELRVCPPSTHLQTLTTWIAHVPVTALGAATAATTAAATAAVAVAAAATVFRV
jgi:hypothetical protein